MTALDRNYKPLYDEPLWSEGRWNASWSAEHGVGTFIHAGRFRHNRDLWWARTIALLPDGRLVVDRSWGRAVDDLGLHTTAVDVRVHEDGWTSHFDGVGELCDPADMAARIVGSGAPSVAMTWDVTATAHSPAWQLGEGTSDDDLNFASHAYTQRSFTTAGELRVGDATYPLDGVGFMDHSCGDRDWLPWGSHFFTLAVMPEYTVHAMRLWGPDDELQRTMGVAFPKGGEPQSADAMLPRLEDAFGSPREFDIALTLDGTEVTVRAEMVRVFTLSITNDNDNINGIDWSYEGDPLIVVAGYAKLTAPNGDVGYAHLERSVRRSRLDSKTFARPA